MACARGHGIVTDGTKAAMRAILADIQSGAFAREWVAEHAAGKPRFNRFRANWAAHPIEKVGKTLRGLMPWMRGPERAPQPVEARGGASDFGFRMM